MMVLIAETHETDKDAFTNDLALRVDLVPKYNRFSVTAALSGMLLCSCIVRGAQADERKPDPSHADAAVIFAKYSGLFDRYVPEDATLNDCVAFMNRTGIYFGLLEVVNGTDFKPEDCARVMGQINLVFSGEAEYSAGKIKLPEGIESWKDFCILNDVKYIEGYRNLVSILTVLHDLAG